MILPPLLQIQNRGADGGFDMNVRKAWERGYTGKGVVITILDDGIEYTHPDLAPNYVSIQTIIAGKFVLNYGRYSLLNLENIVLSHLFTLIKRG